MLGFAPFPMNLDAHKLGYVFTGWGLLVAIFAIVVAPRLERRLGVARTLYLNLSLFAVDILIIALGVTDQPVLIGAVIASGAFIGVNNTVTTQAVMTVAPVERPVASAAYGFVRFIGAGLAPYVAGRLAASAGLRVPFFVGLVAVVAGIAILASGHRFLTAAEQAAGHDEAAERDQVAGHDEAAEREQAPSRQQAAVDERAAGHGQGATHEPPAQATDRLAGGEHEQVTLP